jgi:hypothetical protein
VLNRRREPDALRGALEQLVEPLQRDGKVGSALRAGDGVDLVDDHGLHRRQRFAGASQRRPQVAPHVDRQPLERRGVQHPQALLGGGSGLGRHPVDRREKGGERLDGAAGGDHQRVLPAGDRLPGLRLRRVG